MQGRRLVGKTIKRVHQRRHYGSAADSRPGFTALVAVEFTDGTVLRFTAVETEYGGPVVEPIYPGRPIGADDK